MKPFDAARPVALALLLALPAAALPAAGHAQAAATEVKVERVKPAKEKLETLRFLKANVDFIRAQFDRLREKSVAARGDAETVDPRFLTYRDLLARSAADRDSAAAIAARQERSRLLASVRDLGALEDRLDGLERLLDAQQIRLATLQRDFAGRQRTELIVLVRGVPASPVRSVTLTVGDGAAVEVPITAADAGALADGGVMQVFHACVEPREQVVAFRVAGDGWTGAPAGYMTLSPDRDRLTLLEIDLSGAQPTDGGAGVHARAWLHDDTPPAVDG